MVRSVIVFVCLTFLLAAAVTQAAVPPFTEDFAADTALWGDNGGGPLSYVPTGGPDGSGYASENFAFSDPNSGGDSVVLYRGQDEFGSSDGAFEGNWIADQVRVVTAQVRHNAFVPLNYFMRGSGPGNFPGAVAVDFVPVLPNQWTEVSFNLNPNSPQFVSFEGTNWGAVFSNVGHLQFGVSVPEALAGSPTPFTFDIDKISIATPEPSTICLAGVALLRFAPDSRLRPLLN